MKFGIHNASWVFGADPVEAFEGVKRTAQWAENELRVCAVRSRRRSPVGRTRFVGRRWSAMEISPGTLGAEADRCASAVAS